MSIFVGALQCVLPLFLLLRFGGDPSVVQAAFPVFLFGFTYLYVGIAALTGISTEGIGWFFLFVAVSAAGLGVLSSLAGDQSFAVIWAAWAVLWALFFSMFALRGSDWTVFSGWLVTLWALLMTSVPAVLQMYGLWDPGPRAAAGP